MGRTKVSFLLLLIINLLENSNHQDRIDPRRYSCLSSHGYLVFLADWILELVYKCMEHIITMDMETLKLKSTEEKTGCWVVLLIPVGIWTRNCSLTRYSKSLWSNTFHNYIIAMLEKLYMSWKSLFLIF